MSLDFKSVYQVLREQHGEQEWWPGDSAFEIMIGAILTQNTAWTNVEKAIANLKQADALSLPGILDLPRDSLAELIRPSGYYNQKAKRLQGFCAWLNDQGGIETLQEQDTSELRKNLLAINGIGPETADDILLYALGRPVFVIDAYTRRLFSRLDLIAGLERYEDLRMQFEASLKGDANLYNEYHALIVIHGKDVCRKSPLCDDCYLQSRCRGNVRIKPG
ncbi:MAG: endonuclease [Acidiferrobacterales bacterium]